MNPSSQKSIAASMAGFYPRCWCGGLAFSRQSRENPVHNYFLTMNLA
jgi:hypothetical protein